MYHCVKFGDCSLKGFHEKWQSLCYLSLTLTFLTLTLGEGHHAPYHLKCIVTKYHCVKFGDCSLKGFPEKWQSLCYLSLTLTFLTLTLDEGHHAPYHLKRIVTKYHCAKFGDCSFKKFQEKWKCFHFFYLWPWPFDLKFQSVITV